MLLWLKKSIKVPKAALNIVVCGHFSEAHLEEDLSVLSPHLEVRWWRGQVSGESHLEERVQGASCR